MRRGQTSLEGIFVVSAIFIMFLFIIGYGFDKRIDTTNTNIFISERNDCFKIANLIMGVFINGNNTEIRAKNDYELTLLPNSKLIEVYNLKENSSINYEQTKITFCSLPINLYSSLLLHAGNIRLKNTGDFVVLDNV